MPPTKGLKVFDGHKLVLFGDFLGVERYSVLDVMRLLECLIEKLMFRVLYRREEVEWRLYEP